MALYDIINYLQIKVSKVSGVGNVHDYEPYVTNPEELQALFLYPTKGRHAKLNGWTITREATPATWLLDQQTLARTHSIVIRGYVAVGDYGRSEIPFQQTVESIVNGIIADNTLGGTIELLSPPQVRIIDHRIFAGTLVHYCEISVGTEVFHE